MFILECEAEKYLDGSKYVPVFWFALLAEFLLRQLRFFVKSSTAFPRLILQAALRMGNLSTMSRILIVDEYPVTCRGLASIISDDVKGFKVISQTQFVTKAIKTIRGGKVDIALVNQFLANGADGIDLISDIKRIRPKTSVIAMMILEGRLYLHQAKEAGASAVYLKSRSTSDFVDILKKVSQGGEFWPTADDTLDCLTDAEIEVFESLGRGFSTREIALKTSRGIKTIQTYCFRIRHKLALKDAVELQDAARSWVSGDKK